MGQTDDVWLAFFCCRKAKDKKYEKHLIFSKEYGIIKNELQQTEKRAAAINAVKQLSLDVGIPADLKEIVKAEDLDFLSESAFADACRPGNPRETSVEEIKELYLKLM